MTTEYSGAGDPQRSIDLLWGRAAPPRRGPKPKFTVAGIVAVAVALADAEGLPAVSMRRVAEQLSVTAMSLYTYIPSKAELLDVMLDTVSAEAVGASYEADGWRERLTEVASRNFALYRRHPWLLQIATTRPVLGPNVIAKYDFELRAFEHCVVPDIEADMMLTLVLNYVAGAARPAVQAEQASQQTGMTDDQWWAAYAPLLTEVLDPERFPTAGRVGQSAGEEYGAGDPMRAYAFGLELVLDGIAANLGRLHP